MHSRYKIIHTTCHEQWGGLEKRIFNESVWMKNQGHEIVIVAPEGTPLFDRAKEYGFRIYPVSFRRLDIFSNYRALKQICRAEQPHILNTHGNEDAKLALRAANASKVPCRILSRHISAHVRDSWANRQIYKKLCHYIFTTADYTTQHLKNVFHLTGAKVFSMPSGIVEPATLLPKDLARDALIQELNLSPGTRFIGFSGRISPDKGVDILINAFGQISAKIPHHLILAGDGPLDYKNKLKQIIERYEIQKRVHFIGFKEDVWSVYRALDCKVLASREKGGIPFEGVPQSLLEAMYCSCPVIGSNSGGIHDIIQDRVTGLLFDKNTPEQLPHLIIETLTQKAAVQKRSQAARERVKHNNTIDAMGRKIIRLYSLHQHKLKKMHHNVDKLIEIHRLP